MEKEDSGFDYIQGICLGTFYAKHEGYSELIKTQPCFQGAHSPSEEEKWTTN